MEVLVKKESRSGRGTSRKYSRGFAKGMKDVRKNLPLNYLYRYALDEFSFGYRAAYYQNLCRCALTKKRMKTTKTAPKIYAGSTGELQ